MAGPGLVLGEGVIFQPHALELRGARVAQGTSCLGSFFYSRGAPPKNHPFLDGIFHERNHPAFLGYPHDELEPPESNFNWNRHGSPIKEPGSHPATWYRKRDEAVNIQSLPPARAARVCSWAQILGMPWTLADHQSTINLSDILWVMTWAGKADRFLMPFPVPRHSPARSQVSRCAGSCWGARDWTWCGGFYHDEQPKIWPSRMDKKWMKAPLVIKHVSCRRFSLDFKSSVPPRRCFLPACCLSWRTGSCNILVGHGKSRTVLTSSCRSFCFRLVNNESRWCTWLDLTSRNWWFQPFDVKATVSTTVYLRPPFQKQVVSWWLTSPLVVGESPHFRCLRFNFFPKNWR